MPSDTEWTQLDQTDGPTASAVPDTVEKSLAEALKRWRDGRDERELRRALLAIATQLD